MVTRLKPFAAIDAMVVVKAVLPPVSRSHPVPVIVTWSPAIKPAVVKLAALVRVLVVCVVEAIVMAESKTAGFAVTFWLTAQPHCAVTPATEPHCFTVAATST